MPSNDAYPRPELVGLSLPVPNFCPPDLASRLEKTLEQRMVATLLNESLPPDLPGLPPGYHDLLQAAVEHSLSHPETSYPLAAWQRQLSPVLPWSAGLTTWLSQVQAYYQAIYQSRPLFTFLRSPKKPGWELTEEPPVAYGEVIQVLSPMYQQAVEAGLRRLKLSFLTRYQQTPHPDTFLFSLEHELSQLCMGHKKVCCRYLPDHHCYKAKELKAFRREIAELQVRPGDHWLLSQRSLKLLQQRQQKPLFEPKVYLLFIEWLRSGEYQSVSLADSYSQQSKNIPQA